MGLEVIESERLEDLADRLSERVWEDQRILGPFGRVAVTVPSGGLGYWWTLRHAGRSGLAAGVRIRFITETVEQILGDGGYLEGELVKTADLQWAFFNRLREGSWTGLGDGGGLLERMLRPGDTGFERRCWIASGKVADLMDRYFIYRPEWILQWCGDGKFDGPGPHAGWQRGLLRSYMDREGMTKEDLERRNPGLAAARCLREGASPGLGDWKRLHFFTLGTYPPIFLRLLEQLSRERPVCVYSRIPGEVYLGDLPANYLEAMRGLDESEEPDCGEWLANPLLAANGQRAARQQALLLDIGLTGGAEPAGPMEHSWLLPDLQQIQVGIRENRPVGTLKGDGTLTIHNCHGRLREVQILQQQLLALLEADKDLNPEDILVFLPEVEIYAPLIEGVFELGTVVNSGHPRIRLPFSIGDRNPRGASEVLRLNEDLFEFVLGRQELSCWLRCLRHGAIRRRTGVEEVDPVLELFQRAGIRWGLDWESREAAGMPGFEEFSWEDGLSRIFSGSLLPDAFGVDGKPLVPSSGDLDWLGHFLAAWTPVFALIRDRDRKRTPQAWKRLWLALLRSILEEGDEGAELLRHCVELMEGLADFSGHEEVGMDTFREMARGALDRKGRTGGILRRGISFCGIVPGRPLAAKVICVLGLNGSEFPRKGTRNELDLMESGRGSLEGTPFAYREEYPLGDPNGLQEDRNAFLEIIQCAGERLHLFYQGHDETNSEEMPPSICIEEILQMAAAAREKILVNHPLQEWSGKNYEGDLPEKGEAAIPVHFDNRPLSWSVGGALPTAFAGTNPEAGEPARRVEVLQLEELIRFFRDPAKYFLQHTFGIQTSLDSYTTNTEDEEPFVLDALESWKLRACLLSEYTEWVSAGAGDEETFAGNLLSALRSMRRWPLGRTADAYFQNHFSRLITILETERGEAPVEWRSLRKAFGDTTLESKELFVGGKQWILLPDPERARYRFEAYLRDALSEDSALILATKAPFRRYTTPCDFNFQRQRLEHIPGIIQLLRRGSGHPLAFNLETGSEFVRLVQKEAGKDSVDLNSLLESAYSLKWEASKFSPGENSIDQQMCFGGDAAFRINTEWKNAWLSNCQEVLSPVVNWGNLFSKGGNAR